MHYPMRLVLGSDQAWHASFRDVPLVQIQAGTPEQTRKKAADLLVKTLYQILQYAGEIPAPSRQRLGEELVELPHDLVKRIQAGCRFMKPQLSIEESTRLLKLARQWDRMGKNDSISAAD